MPRDRVSSTLVPRAVFCALVLAAPVLGACAGAAPQEAERYPEKKRPEPLRSASDGEVMGANEQSPEDTLEGSLTTGHAAPKGPRAEAEEAHQRLDHEECEEENQKPPEPSADGTAAAPKKKRLCPPAPPASPED